MKILSITGQEYELERVKYKGGDILVLSNPNDTVFLISDDLYNIQKIAKVAAGVYDKAKEKPKQKIVEVVEVDDASEIKNMKKVTYPPVHKNLDTNRGYSYSPASPTTLKQKKYIGKALKKTPRQKKKARN